MESSRRTIPLPPAYGQFLGQSSNRRQTSHSGSVRSRRTEHSYTLTSSKNVPWVKLAVISRALSPSHLPSFFEGEDVTGSLSLMLDREESIKSISVSIIGQMTTSATDVYSFLLISQDLWTKAMGDPSPTAQSSSSKFSGKLRGDYSWPFSFTIPAHVTLANQSGTQETWRIPPSFSERLTRVHIQYQLICHLRRGKFRIDSKIGTVFAFIPIIKPTPFSDVRKLAYVNNSTLPGPDLDPIGWERLPTFRLRGQIFKARAVETRYTLWLAKPLAYTRGSVLPCTVHIECSDVQALDLLASPEAMDIRLRRHISMGLADVSSISARAPAYGIEFEETTEEIKSAVWWPTRHGTTYRALDGEIHLPRELKPSCCIGRFRLSYTIDVYPLKAVAFIPDSEDARPLASQVVDMVTAYAPGPRPRVYCPSPPSYDDASSILPPS
ncbi:unnamed protein product [Somion occarium]|uniref:Arrestin-like N-terminal domain-containing protein n=1 Tax=Somion occarium TaxID=3059160 RepID=A0ABP1DT81_9APHY